MKKSMNSLRATLVLLVSVLGVDSASAYDYAYNNMYFNLNQADKTAALTYNTNSYNSYKGEIEVPEVIIGPKDIEYTVTAIGDNALRNSSAVSKITIPYTITSIGSYALSGCSGITSVSIPASVTIIGDYAFSDCKNLVSATLNEGLLSIGARAFQNTVLREVSLPATVTSIGSYCFYAGSTAATLETAYLSQAITTIPEGCFRGQSKLISAKWSDSLEVVGNDAFYGCSSLKTAVFSDSIRSVGSQAFYNCSALSSLTVPASLTSIGNDAFLGSGIVTLTYAEGCTATLPTYATNTTRVNLPSTITSITANAFSRFTRLTEISIPEGVTTIGSSAFDGCTSLAFADIPSSVTHINSRAFYGCNTLKVLKFPNAIEFVGSEAFRGCGSLASLSIPACLKSVGTDAFRETGIKTLTFEEGHTTTFQTYAYDISTLKLPSTLTSIGAGTFENYTKLTNLTIPESVESIASRAFYGCSILTIANKSSNIRYISSEAFRNCTSLAQFPASDSLLYIGNNAFRNCSTLSVFDMKSSVLRVESEAFRDCSALTSLTVPASLTYIGADAYTNSGVKELVYANGCTKTLRTYANNTTKLTLPSTITEIEAYAFYNFSRLSGVALNEGLLTIGANAFKGCSQVVALTMPASVTTIGTDAFASSGLAYLIYAPGCKTLLRTYSTELSSVVIPASATDMPADAFKDCNRLEDIYISDIEMWNYLFRDKTSNPIPSEHRIYLNGNMLTKVNVDLGFSVQPYAFANCKELTTVNITPSVTGIREHAFEGCPDLESVAIGSRVFAIGKSAFADCKMLSSVRLTPGTKKIDDNAFLNCSALNHFHFGGTETYIGASAFKGCISLENVNIPDVVTDIKSAAFADCSGLQQVVLPSTLTAVADNVFSNCVSLRSVEFGDNVTRLGAHAFENCDALQTVQLPDTLTTIGDYCFNDCDSIRYAYLGAKVTSVGSYAFAKCARLVGFYCDAVSVPTCSSTAFSSSDPEYINLYVPASALSAYSSKSPWSSFGNKQSVEDAPKWVQSIALSAPVVLLKEGETQNLSATINPSDASNQKINWKSSNTAVAYVANTGMLLGNDPGSATITATAADGGGARTSCTVIVDNDYKAVSSITLSATELTLREGRIDYLYASLSPKSPTYGNVVWSSSDSKVAIVNQSGQVTALSAGEATIKCMAADGKGAMATCDITVEDAVSPVIGDANDDGEVSISDIVFVARMILESTDVGGDITLYDINGDGEITVADIVWVANTILGNTGTPGEIHVFSLTPKEIEIDSLEQYQLEFIMIPSAGASAVRWSSSNPEIATVDSYGVVTGITPGEAMIYVEADNGYVDSCKVKVKAPIEYFYLELPDWTSTNHSDSSTDTYTYTTFEAKKGYVMSFDWTVSSESGYDYLIVTRNGTEILKESGEGSGTYKYTFTSDGQYTIVVKYTKDSSTSKGSDKASIKNFKVEGIKQNNPTDNPDYGNHEYVDLGLPSSIKWATCNVGAENPEDYGDYFAWGETTGYNSGKTSFSWSTYKWCNGSSSTMTKYCASSSYGTVDNKTILDPEDDAAHVNWGGSWRMPTRAEQDELRTKCTWAWTTQNGVYGRKVTGPNGNSIFLPAAGYRSNDRLYGAGSSGYYWSSSLSTSYSGSAYCLYFNSSYVDCDGYYYRYYGRSVRPVCQ